MGEYEEPNRKIIRRDISIVAFVAKILFLGSESGLPHKYSDRTGKKPAPEDVSPYYPEDLLYRSGRHKGSKHRTRKYGLSSKARIMLELISEKGRFMKLSKKQMRALKKALQYEAVRSAVRRLKMPLNHRIWYLDVQEPDEWQHMVFRVKSRVRVMRARARSCAWTARYWMHALAKPCAETAYYPMYALVRRVLVRLDSQLSDCMLYPAKTKRELVEALVLENGQTRTRQASQTKQPSQTTFYASMLVVIGTMCAIVTHAILNAG